MNFTTEIRCPSCYWKPPATSQWTCHNCGEQWDAFSTIGRCPSCAETLEDLHCPEWHGGCGSLSPLLDWYDGLDDGLREINVEKIS